MVLNVHSDVVTDYERTEGLGACIRPVAGHLIPCIQLQLLAIRPEGIEMSKATAKGNLNRSDLTGTSCSTNGSPRRFDGRQRDQSHIPN